MSSTRHSTGIEDTLLEFANYLAGVLGRENGEESMNFRFLLVLITNVPKIPEMWKGDLNLVTVPRQQAQQ